MFLRILEYYTGILFLTTNHVGHIDEAFRSRIHITLYYPNLGKRETNRIWKLNLDRLRSIEEERATSTDYKALTIDVDGIKKFAADHYNEHEQGKGRWNGRQIRNAFLIASAFARMKKRTLAPGQSTWPPRRSSISQPGTLRSWQMPGRTLTSICMR